jgi:hypothetical protein
MSLDPRTPGSPNTSGTGNRTRRSVFGRVFGGIGWLSAGPADWAGLSGVCRGASFIRGLSVGLKAGSLNDPRFRMREDNGFDLEATAFLQGISVLELQRRLVLRRRQTARIAYVTFVLGCIFLIGWVCEALSSPWSAGRMVLALEFLPFCALFFLVAFYHALLNFQIRIHRSASWHEYLATSEPFWPR